jgi:hypothetical protein
MTAGPPRAAPSRFCPTDASGHRRACMPRRSWSYRSTQWSYGLVPFHRGVRPPLFAAPVLVRSRGRRALGARVRAPSSHRRWLAWVNRARSPSSCTTRATDTLPPLNLDWPLDHFGSGTRAPRHRMLAGDPGRLVRWMALGAGQTSATGLALPTGRRGVFSIGPLRLWVHDPFGLLASPVVTAAPVALVVHPPSAPSSVRALPSDVADHLTATGIRGTDTADDDPGGELSGLRPYVPGDRLHLLSWPVEARYGALMVQQFRPEGNALIRIVLDDRAGVHRRPRSNARSRCCKRSRPRPSQQLLGRRDHHPVR